ncbi:MAG: reverse transcriptase family protein, partial [Kangiellaceae bacterium]|nr:reverse transcriptase family protein [Kangiellaceae bacterium]
MPVVNPPKKIPFALQEKVKAELQRMESLGVIQKVAEPTEWVNSLVTVHKPDGSLRLCIDPTHLNKAIKRAHYPLTTVEQVMARIPGAKFFSTLDAKTGFWQIRLDEASSNVCTFNTPWGRYRFLRLPPGTVDAPEVY